MAWLRYLQCISNGDAAGLHWANDIAHGQWPGTDWHQVIDVFKYSFEIRHMHDIEMTVCVTYMGVIC